MGIPLRVQVIDANVADNQVTYQLLETVWRDAGQPKGKDFSALANDGLCSGHGIGYLFSLLR